MPAKTSKRKKFKDTMRPEYYMTGGVRGKYAARFPQDMVMVTLAPYVAAGLACECADGALLGAR